MRDNPVNFKYPSGLAQCSNWQHGCDDESGLSDAELAAIHARKGTEGNTTNSNPVATALATASLVLDSGGLVLSAINAGLVDTVRAFLVGVGCAGGRAAGGITVGAGCGAGFLAALGFDIAYEEVSPLSFVENILGVGSAATTAGSDLFSGNDKFYLDQSGKIEITVGKDTLVSVRNVIAGFTPEANIDAAISFSQLLFDTDRIGGVKGGGTIPITNGFGILNAISQFFSGDWW